MSAAATDLELSLWLSTSLKKIPPISPLVGKLVALRLDRDEAFEQLENIISTDPSLSAKLIGLANSAYYGGGSRTCISVSDALVRLGLQQSWQTAIGLVFGRAMHVDAELAQAKELLWLHSYATGTCARELVAASSYPEQADLAFLGGFLHDIGYLPIMALEPLLARRLIDLASNPDVTTLSRNLEERLGLPAHPIIGATLCELWGVPEPVRYLVANHQSSHDLVSRNDPDFNPAQVGVCIGHTIAKELLDTLPMGSTSTPKNIEHACAELGLSHARYARLFDSLSRRIESLEAVAQHIAST